MKTIIIGVIAALLTTTGMAGETVLDMPLNNKSEIKDQSTVNNSAKLVGKATIKDDALILDGKKSYLNCGENQQLDIGKGNVTIIATIKIAPEQPERSGIVSKGAGSSSSAGYAFMYRLPRKAFYFYLSNGKKRAGFQSKSNDLNDGKWHTVAVSLNRGVEVVFALDGKIRGVRKAQTIPTEDDISNSQIDLLIGSWGGAHCFNGAIKNVKIIKKAFSPQETADLTK